jgi:hypothetical protein
MKEDTNSRTKWLHIRLNPQEYDKLHKLFSKTTCRKMSEYARKILLNKPVTEIYRNQSLDDFMAEMMKLRNELNGIGNNFNQAVKKLHTLHQIPEFRDWLKTHEMMHRNLLEKVENIKVYIQKTGEKWLQ